MSIQVFGLGCPTCKKFYDLTRAAVTANNLSEEVEYVTDVVRLQELGAMQLPALVIDGQIVVAGHLPSRSEFVKIIAKHKKSA